jgi:ABC-type sugar transport system permease subunit
MSENSVDQPQEKMIDDSDTSKEVGNKKPKRILSIILGVLFILPALGVLIFTKIIPTILTALISFQDRTLFQESGTFIGMRNYDQVFSSSVFVDSLQFTSLLVLVRVFVILIPVLFLALGAASLKRVGRKIIRVFATLPWMLYSPIALGIAWVLIFNPMVGFGNEVFTLRNPETAQILTLVIDGLSFFGLAAGLGITVFLSALKGENSDKAEKRPIRTIILLYALLIFGTIAISLQGGSVVNLLTGGGPQNLTSTFQGLLLRQTFNFAQIGLGSAMASILIVAAIILGLGVTIIIILTNLRLFKIPSNTEPVSIAKWIKILAIIFMVIFLLILFLSIVPYIARFIPLFRAQMSTVFENISEVIQETPFWQSLLNTWMVPSVIVLLIQFPITYLAALGIGALRPLGKGSEWLLLIFAPWIFMTELLLIPGLINIMLDLELTNTFLGYAIPYLLNIPMLFILVMFFRGQNQKYGQESSNHGFFQKFVWPSLPLLAICLVFSLLYIQQEMVWSVSILTDPTKQLLPGFFRRLLFMNFNRLQDTGWLLTLTRIPAFIFAFLLFGGYQIFFFPRLGIKSGKHRKK